MKKTLAHTFIVIVYSFICGFNLDNATIPKEDILQGGPPKDGIPAILAPKFIRPPQADFLKPDDQIIGVMIKDESKAYPIKILNLHEVVNDTLSGVPIAVTF